MCRSSFVVEIILRRLDVDPAALVASACLAVSCVLGVRGCCSSETSAGATETAGPLGTIFLVHIGRANTCSARIHFTPTMQYRRARSDEIRWGSPRNVQVTINVYTGAWHLPGYTVSTTGTPAAMPFSSSSRPVTTTAGATAPSPIARHAIFLPLQLSGSSHLSSPPATQNKWLPSVAILSQQCSDLLRTHLAEKTRGCDSLRATSGRPWARPGPLAAAAPLAERPSRCCRGTCPTTRHENTTDVKEGLSQTMKPRLGTDWMQEG